jgi:Flp pilus assembly protein TadB
MTKRRGNYFILIFSLQLRDGIALNKIFTYLRETIKHGENGERKL